MKRIIYFFLLLFLIGCSGGYEYTLSNNVNTIRLNFTKCKWLIGNIEANSDVKEELTKLVLNDFSIYLGERVKYSLNEKSILIGNKTPLNPSKKEIKNLKIGTGYDYFININCENTRSDLSNFNYTEHNYFKKQMIYVACTLEIYDLNNEKIIYTQTSKAEVDENSTIDFNMTNRLIKGCYKKVMNDIKENATIK